MVRKLTALLMFAIAIANALALGGSEHALACDSAEDVISVSPHGDNTTQAQIIAAGSHQEPDDCGACHHQGSGNHQCHFGHCHSVIATTSSSLVKPDGLTLRQFANLSWLSIHLPSPDRPPRA